MSLPANTPPGSPDASAIAGSVLPIARAEELLAGLPGVISAKIVAGQGGVEEIHVLTTTDVAPKQTVRNIESALIAQLGMRVSHKKISVATSGTAGAARTSGPVPQAVVPPEVAADPNPKRRLYFEDVEVRRSRTRGVACRVTLREGDQSYSGEAEGLENERLRVDLSARATVVALNAAMEPGGAGRNFALEGCRVIEAFDREFVFVGVTTRKGRETQLLTGSAEIRESPETSAVLAVLDATNRCLEFER